MRLHGGDLRFDLPATLDSIEQVCADFQLWRPVQCTGSDAFAAELILREALTNSVVHGCSENPEKRIFCVLRSKTDRLLIGIRDEGEGFDWRKVRGRRAELSETHGRGIEIFRRYASAFRYGPKGAAITLVRRFQRGNEA